MHYVIGIIIIFAIMPQHRWQSLFMCLASRFMKSGILTQNDEGSYRIYDYFFSEWFATAY